MIMIMPSTMRNIMCIVQEAGFGVGSFLSAKNQNKTDQ